ncbi:hypothetical protein [Arthrobacter sp. PAMC25284]|uniref:hypothetical protein n=1 Tax=Arthrobacter sp. PAMC25284 TaxID=2861279 RepID=UPI001C628D38|nr:hypothetical protein [Arthrobacter sp. PAMC25284]QYF88505.1 hypothetical protein KY499_09415 [Arthrobacter sp. PAMC25284]
MLHNSTLLLGFAVVAIAATTACGSNVDGTSVRSYCEVAERADSRISAELIDFDPEKVTPARLEKLLGTAVAETAATSDAAPDEIAAELKLLKERWRAQQQSFADVEYIFAAASAQVMDLEGEEREAFEVVAKYNHDKCGLGHEPGTDPEHSH